MADYDLMTGVKKAYEAYSPANKPTAADVGLGNVDNTTDSMKNVLSATKLTTSKIISQSNIGKSFDGSDNITWGVTESSYWRHGSVSDAKSGMLLIARKYVGTLKNAEGFIGRVILSSGSPTSTNFLSWADVVIRSAYNTNRVELIDLSIVGASIQIAEVTYNNEVWYALYFPSASSRVVTTIGEFFTAPILISDATSYTTSSLIYTPTNYSSRYKPTAADIQNVVSPVSAGGIIERGSNANGEYVKFADGTMICTRLGIQGVLSSAATIYTTVTYAATFVELNSITAHAGFTDLSANLPPTFSGPTAYNVTSKTSSLTGAAIGILSNYSFTQGNADVVRFGYTAVGRWK